MKNMLCAMALLAMSAGAVELKNGAEFALNDDIWTPKNLR